MDREEYNLIGWVSVDKPEAGFSGLQSDEVLSKMFPLYLDSERIGEIGMIYYEDEGVWAVRITTNRKLEVRAE